MILVKENVPAQVKLFKVQPAGPFILKTFAGNAELYSVRKSSWKVIQQLYNNAVLAANAKGIFIMDSKFIKVPFRFTLETDHSPYQQLGVLFDVQSFPESTLIRLKIRSVGFCGMDVQRFLSKEQITAIEASCRLSLDTDIEAVDNDAPTRDNVDTSQLHSDFT